MKAMTTPTQARPGQFTSRSPRLQSEKPLTERYKVVLTRLLSSPSRDRDGLFAEAADFLKPGSPNFDDLATITARMCSQHWADDRHAVGIDLLSQCGQRLLRFVEHSIHEDVKRWRPTTESFAYGPDSDYWSILMRSLGRSEVPADERLSVIALVKNAADHAMVEGMIDALRDVDTHEAYEVVKHVRDSTDMDSVRRYAQQVCEEADQL
jgi:hypothetical protein